MKEEEHEDEQLPEPRSGRGFIADFILSNPRNFFFTIASVLVVGTMLSNGVGRPASRVHHTVKPNPDAALPASSPESAKPESPAEATAPALPEKKQETQAETQTPKTEPATETPAAASPAVQNAVSEAALSEISRTHDQLAALEQKIAEQEKTINALSDQLQSVAALRDKMDAMETRSTSKLASITLFGQLRDAVSRGEPFKPQLDQLLELNKSNPRANALLIQLLPVAGTGVNNPAELQKHFADALAATLQNDEDGSLSGNLKKLIRIRKIGSQQTGMDDESILARAEASVTAQDFPAAIKTLAALSPEGKKSMTAWTRSALEYVDTQNTLAALQLPLSGIGQPQPAAAPAEKPLPSPLPPVSATTEPSTSLELAIPAESPEKAKPETTAKEPPAKEDLTPDEIAQPEKPDATVETKDKAAE